MDKNGMKKAAARRACQWLVEHLCTLNLLSRRPRVGIGSGSTVACFISESLHVLRTVECVAASTATELMLLEGGLAVVPLGSAKLDVAIDGADSVFVEELVMIKGGGAALLREKILFEAAVHRLVVVDETKIDRCATIPLEVLPMAAAFLRDITLKANCSIRTEGGRPVVTDNANLILDYPSNGRELSGLKRFLESHAGVLETGIFEIAQPTTVVVAMRDGDVRVMDLG